MKKVLIVGGGVIGQFSGYYLAKAGHQVTIVDENARMTPASEGNCGLVTPSHIIPLNSYKAMWDGIKWLGQKDAPLRIKPQLDRRFLAWFVRFALSSNVNAVKKATEVRHQLLQQSFRLYEEFFKQEQTSSEWKKDGLLYVCKDKSSLPHFEHEVAVHEQYGMQSRLIGKDEAYEIEPQLEEGIVGGALMEMDGWLNPTMLLQDLRTINSEMGIEYLAEKIDRISAKGNRVTSIGIDIDFDEIVLAAGAKTPLLADQLGIQLPVIPGKGYNLTAKIEGDNIRRPVYMVERRVVATPWKNRLRIGSTMEFTGYDLELSEKRLEALKRASKEYIKLKLENFDLQPWTGWRPMKDNGIPIIEKNTKFNNLTIATGHSMVGLSMAPATGKIVQGLLSNPK